MNLSNEILKPDLNKEIAKMNVSKVLTCWILCLGFTVVAEAGTASKLAPGGLGGTDLCERNWSRGCDGCYTGRLMDGGAVSSKCSISPKCNQTCKDQPLE